MAITKLKSFGGEAEVLGRLAEFEYDDGSVLGENSQLVIYGLTLQEAESALIMLSSGRVEGVRPPTAGTTGAPPPVPEGAGARTKPEPPPPPKVEGKKEKPSDLDKVKVGKPPDTEKPAAAADTKPAAGETKQPPAETKSPPAETKPPAAETKPADTKPAETAPADGDPDAVFIKASKMRDILYALQDRGINDEAAMVAECERLKNKVTLLAKMPNIADRVKRTLEVMKGGVAA